MGEEEPLQRAASDAAACGAGRVAWSRSGALRVRQDSIMGPFRFFSGSGCRT